MMVRLHPILNDLKTKDVVIALLIIALPFLNYVYKLAPDVPIWKTDWFIINSGIWLSAKYFLWIINFKLLLILLLIIWFITSNHWWRYIILIPTIIELFKLWSSFDKSSNSIDEIEFLQSLPLTIPILILVFLLSKKLGYSSKYKSLSEEINQEIEKLIEDLNLINQKDLIILKEEFDIIKKNKCEMTNKDYNNKLLKLRKQLMEKI